MLIMKEEKQPNEDNVQSAENKKDSKLMHDQFMRLSKSSTQSFTAKTTDPGILTPRDSLDFTLNSMYDHHFHWWAPKNITALQQHSNSSATINRGNDLKVSNRDIHKMCSCPVTTQELQSSSNEYRNNINHVAIGVTAPHLSNSRRGFGRSADGVFYNL